MKEIDLNFDASLNKLFSDCVKKRYTSIVIVLYYSCLHSSAVQRSRSCTDSEDGRGKTRGHTHHAVPDKV